MFFRLLSEGDFQMHLNRSKTFNRAGVNFSLFFIMIMVSVSLSFSGLALSRAFCSEAKVNFEMICLGAGGGDVSSDLTSLMVKPADYADYSVILDGGSVAEGIVEHGKSTGKLSLRADPEERVKYVAEVLKKVEGIILTHSHLDHVSGFTVLGPLFLNMHFQWKTPSFRVLASPETFESLETLLYSGKIWGNFGYFPKGNTILKYEKIAIGQTFEIGGLRGTRFLVDHPVESSAFLLENSGGAKFLFFGDTGQLRKEFYDVFNPYVADRTLRGVILEVSFPSASKDLAAKTCHLTRDTLLIELGKLAGLSIEGELPFKDEFVAEQAAKIAVIIDFPIYIVHIKPWDYRQVVSELETLKKAGINIIVTAQGEHYSF